MLPTTGRTDPGFLRDSGPIRGFSSCPFTPYIVPHTQMISKNFNILGLPGLLGVLGAFLLLTSSTSRAAYYDNQLNNYSYYVSVASQYYAAASTTVLATGTTGGYAEAADNALTVAYSYYYCYLAGVNADLAYGYYAPIDYVQSNAYAAQAAALGSYGIQLYYSTF